MNTFQRSYGNFESYPLNLVSNDIYPGNLITLKSRLDTESIRLCIPESNAANVFCRDIFCGDCIVPFSKLLTLATDFCKRYHTEMWSAKMMNKSRLTWKMDQRPAQWPLHLVTIQILIVDSCKTLCLPEEGLCTDKYNSFLTAPNSRAKLRVTRQMLARILSYHQVDASYLDFLFAFGMQEDPLDLAFAGFRGRTSHEIDTISNDPDLLNLGRSEKRLQLCYNLKTVATDSTPDTDISETRWSIRHLAVHHQFDIENGRILWVLTRGGHDIKSRIQDLTGSNGDPDSRSFESPKDSFRSSLVPHLLYSHWATENWRWYIRWAEQIFAMTVCSYRALHLQ